MSYAKSHLPSRIYWDDSPPWEMFSSPEKAMRLIVFVHGFGGRTLSSWAQFQQSGRIGPWWEESDMLFVGYRSTRENISSAADGLRRHLPDFYPRPVSPPISGNALRARNDDSRYEELILVGHSLGGLVIRCALVDAVQEWVNNEPPGDRPAILDAETRLFSPASAGFRPAGLLGLADEIGILRVAQLRLGMSSAYRDLGPGGTLIDDVRQRTKDFFELTSEPALRARILWANPDNVVKAEWYATDSFRDSTDWGQSHMTVCKPDADYELPWLFVEKGVRTT